MLGLWIALLTLVVSCIAFYPLITGRYKHSGQKRDQLNKAFYFERLKEVEQEVGQGIIDDPTRTQQELQQSLLDDIPEVAVKTQMSKPLNRAWFVLLIAVLGIGASMVYWQTGSWFSPSMMTMSHQKLNYFYDRIKNEEQEPLSTEELNQFAMGLRVELQQHPDDDQTWFMLGQVAMALENGQMALESFNQASRLKPNNNQYKLRQAEILLASADPQDKMQGETLLKAVMRNDHTNLDALRLLAFHAFEQEDYQMAAMSWGMMLKLMPANDPRRATVERSVQSALQLIQQQKKPLR